MAETEDREARRAARLRDLGETPEGIRLDSPESVDRWNAGERPTCVECGARASWSTVVHSWIHLSPAFVGGKWIEWPPTPHNVVMEWRPK